MSERISLSPEETWNTRLKEAMERKKISQRVFAEEYSKKFGITDLPDGSRKKARTSQADVSRWTHVGDLDSKSGKPRGFPDYKTMRNIASLLDVSVSYLTGESDYESFNLESASKYIGLSQDAIKSIRRITKPIRIKTSVPPYYSILNNTYGISALESFLTNKKLDNYLNALYAFIKANKSGSISTNSLDFVYSKLPLEYRDEASRIFVAKATGNDKMEEQSEELKNCVELLELAHDWDWAQTSSAEIIAQNAEYELIKSHTILLDEMKKVANSITETKGN